MVENDDKLEGVAGLQQGLNAGMQGGQLTDSYQSFHDLIENKNRYWFAKVINGEALSLATFREEEPVKGITSYSLNYSVAENHRGKGLAVQAANKGIEELKKHLQRPFYVDAIIDETNVHSINVAKQIFLNPGQKTKDHFTGVPSILFVKLIRT